MASRPPYATRADIVWSWTFRLYCAAVFVFLIAPILVIVPLSFNAESFFSFTRGMLTLDPAAYSLRG